MKELDEFLTFLFENIEDERIEVTKKMKYGHRHFSINIYLESVEQDVVTGNNTYTTTNGGHVNFTSSYNNINIVVDCRNKCIDFNVNMDEVVIEDDTFTEKWANILDEYLKNKLEVRVNTLINLALSKTDLLREYKIKKIL
jgi:hypothetical protein